MKHLHKVREALSTIADAMNCFDITGYWSEFESAKSALSAHEEEVRELVEALKFIFEHIADPERGPRDLYPAFGLNATRAVEMVRAALNKVKE